MNSFHELYELEKHLENELNIIKKSVRSNQFKIIQYCFVIQTFITGFFSFLSSNNPIIENITKKNLYEIIHIFNYSVLINLLVIIFSVGVIILSRANSFEDRKTFIKESKHILPIEIEIRDIKIKFKDVKNVYNIFEIFSLILLIFAIYYPIFKYLSIINKGIEDTKSIVITKSVNQTDYINSFIGYLSVFLILFILFVLFIRFSHLIKEFICNLFQKIISFIMVFRRYSDKIYPTNLDMVNVIQKINDNFSFEDLSFNKSYIKVYLNDKVILPKFFGDKLLNGFEYSDYSIIITLKFILSGKVLYFYFVKENKIIDKFYFTFNEKYVEISDEFKVNIKSDEIELEYFCENNRNDKIRLSIYKNKKFNIKQFINVFFIDQGISFCQSRRLGFKKSFCNLNINKSKKLVLSSNILLYSNIYIFLYITSYQIKNIPNGPFNILFYVLTFLIFTIYLKNIFRFYNKLYLAYLISFILLIICSIKIDFDILIIYFNTFIFTLFILFTNKLYIFILNNNNLKNRNSWI